MDGLMSVAYSLHLDDDPDDSMALVIAPEPQALSWTLDPVSIGGKSPKSLLAIFSVMSPEIYVTSEALAGSAWVGVKVDMVVRGSTVGGHETGSTWKSVEI
jgi:hypothetical protein